MSTFLIKEQLRITELVTLFKIHYESGYSYEGSAHEPRGCLYVISGEIQVTCEGIMHQLSEGDIIFHKPNEFHQYFVNGKGSCDVLIFSYFGRGPILDFFNDKRFHLLPDQKNMVNDLLAFLKPNLIGESAATHFLTSKDDVYLALVASKLEHLLMSLHYYHYYESDASAKSITKRAVKYMHLHIREQTSLEDIAAYCGISVSKLKGIFAAEYSIGVHKYFISLKICRSIQLLKKGMNVSEVSEYLGFVSQPYFSTCFKRETGLSPSQYKSKFL